MSKIPRKIVVTNFVRTKNNFVMTWNDKGEISYSFPNLSSKDRTWSAVPDALLGVISCRSGVRAVKRPQRADVL